MDSTAVAAEEVTGLASAIAIVMAQVGVAAATAAAIVVTTVSTPTLSPVGQLVDSSWGT